MSDPILSRQQPTDDMVQCPSCLGNGPCGYCDGVGGVTEDCFNSFFDDELSPSRHSVKVFDVRTQVAIGLWDKFANAHHIEWENESHKAEYLAAVDDITTNQLFNLLLSRIDFDGMDENTFTIGELRRAI